MKTRTSLITVSSLAASLLAAESAIAADYCRIDNGAVQNTYTLPTVTGTNADTAWKNTGVRRVSSDLAGSGIAGKITGGYIHAVDSAVTLYYHTGNDLDGQVFAQYCPQGKDCWASWNPGSFPMNSFKCQREFGHRSIVGVAQNPLVAVDNPIFPMSGAVSQIDAAFVTAIAATPEVKSFSDGDTQVRWSTGWNFQKAMGNPTPGSLDRYNDLLQIHKGFSVHPNSIWVGNYGVTVDYFLAPVLNNQSLEFWWAGNVVWVAAGLAHDQVMAGVNTAVNGFDGGTMFWRSVRIAAGKAFLQNPTIDDETAIQWGSIVTDHKTRLQFSLVDGIATSATAVNGGTVGPMDSASAPPDVVLNATRTAN